MRIITKFYNEENASAFSQFLSNEKIKNNVEIQKDEQTDTSAPVRLVFSIWILDEDDVEAALKWLDHFKKNPDDPRFQKSRSTMKSFLSIADQEKDVIEEKKNSPFSNSLPKERPMGIITLYLLVTCSILLLFGNLTLPVKYVALPKQIPPIAVYSPPINKSLMFDYPKTYDLIDEILNAYGIESLQNPNNLPEQGKILYRQFLQTPYWHGFYEKIVHKLRNPDVPINRDAPLFEKISQGEIWRLFTPCLLHGGIFHLFFNMLWLIILGKQMEFRLGIMRYILLILITGILSNSAQYLMSGPNFVGISGVLVGMIIFVWVRETDAPWEGYQLHPSSITFIVIVLGLMLAGQMITFVMEVLGITTFSLPIANTAHLAGGLVGYLLGKWRYFSLKK